MCDICGEKDHSAKICANVVTIFACGVDASGSGGDKLPSGEEQEAFVCDAPGKFCDESSEGGDGAHSWQIWDLPVMYKNEVFYHMLSRTSSGMIIYREANVTIRTASGKRYPLEGNGDLLLAFGSSIGEMSLLLRDIAHVPRLSNPFVSIGVAGITGVRALDSKAV